jgi:N-acetylneuraminic acid mutarotase
MHDINSHKAGRMKSILRLAILLYSFSALFSACGGGGDDGTPNPPPASTSKWTWVSGSNLTFQMGIYGTQGTPSSSNIPGARAWGVSWIDSQGKFWLFGGQGPDSADTIGDLNDLWNYNPATGEWTWVSGSDIIGQPGIYGTQRIADLSNVPGARSGCVSWIDSMGKLWLFGGWGYDSAGTRDNLNDLWRYDPATLEWTWISGSDFVGQAGTYGTQGVPASSNVPGGRLGGASWIDSSGNLWLFGGVGLDSASVDSDFLNDLWKYDPATLEWTWVSGSNLINQAGTYGTMGTADPSNVPGARYGPVTWADSHNNLWLFGGYGDDSAGNLSVLNDLWKFDGTNWTWVSGSSFVEQAGRYGTKGTASSSNIPGARLSPVSCIDSQGSLWLFGGWGVDSSGSGYGGDLNDLWKYDGTNWTWLSGSNIREQTGSYGTKGTAAASNVPGAREAAVSWIDASGNLWLFGGFGVNSSGDQELFNDLWRYAK